MNEVEDQNKGKDVWHVEPLVFRHTAYTQARTQAITQYGEFTNILITTES